MLTHLLSLTTPQAGTVVTSETDLAEGELTCPRAHGGRWGSQDWILGLILGVTLCSRKLCCLTLTSLGGRRSFIGSCVRDSRGLLILFQISPVIVGFYATQRPATCLHSEHCSQRQMELRVNLRSHRPHGCGYHRFLAALLTYPSLVPLAAVMFGSLILSLMLCLVLC